MSAQSKSRRMLVALTLLHAAVAAPLSAEMPNILGVQIATAVPTGRAAPEADPEIEDLVKLARRTRDARTEWVPGAALSAARNAHSTNTKEQMREALEHGYNFLEGDLREEINSPHAMEMRHDAGHESGDNLTLRQWLEIGLASGRGLKLDVKEPEHMARILTAVEEWGIDHGRLMFNLGFSSMAGWGDEIRGRFATSYLAINPPSGEGKIQEAQVQQMLSQGRKFGGPVTFVIRFEHLTRAAIQSLQVVGPVSVWNSPYQGREVEDAPKTIARLRALGVAGVIDIRESAGLAEKIEHGVETGLNIARTEVEEGLDRVEGAVESAGRGIVNGARGVGRALGSALGL